METVLRAIERAGWAVRRLLIRGGAIEPRLEDEIIMHLRDRCRMTEEERQRSHCRIVDRSLAEMKPENRKALLEFQERLRQMTPFEQLDYMHRQANEALPSPSPSKPERLSR